ncbi:MAG: bifunctional folylpolyglutamate synthase/dihydrofolate synthase [Acutalibacteraceae bacterium]
MIYCEAIQKINSLLRFGSRPGLEEISKLLDRIGNPQNKCKYIHVAGTNGKGSVCTMIAYTLKEAGYKTGLFISPFIIDFCERIQINNEMISHEELSVLTDKIFPVVEDMAKNGDIITEFELITAIAFEYFAEKKCDVVVLETGLGGLYDSTNVISTPLASVITSISLDHTAVLGSTYEEIAREKCGIIKPNGHTVFYPQQKNVDDIVLATCKEKCNEFINAENADVTSVSYSISGSKFIYNGYAIKTKFSGSHQIKNAKTALTALKAVKAQGFDIKQEHIQRGFEKAFLPARLELLSSSPIVLLDGAHNPDGLRSLARFIKENADGKKLICIMGMLKDKDFEKSLHYIKGLFTEVITVTPDNKRALDCKDLANAANPYFDKVTPYIDKQKAVKYALSKCSDNDGVIICGSLYLAGELRPMLLRELKGQS